MNWFTQYFADILFFLPCICTVGYLLFFALASMRGTIVHPVHKGKFARFLFIVSAIRADDTVLDTVESIMAQDYSEQDFDVVVSSSHNRPVTNLRLKQYRLSLVTTNATQRGAMLQCALEQNSSLKLYDMVIVLDAGDTLDRNFLSCINHSRQSGFKIIQAHRMSRYRDSAQDVMEATFEEINNSVFRRGHVAIGMSSGLTTSGTAYDYSWFKANISKMNGGVKQAEALLLSERFVIDYVDEAHIYSLKSTSGNDFGATRGEWRKAQLHYLRRNIRYLLPAIFTHRYDYADKIIQWMLVPKTWLVTICCFFSFMWPWFYWTIAIKWWLALILLFFAFALAVPDYLIDDAWVVHMRRMPLLALRNIWMALPHRLPKIQPKKISLPFRRRKS